MTRSPTLAESILGAIDSRVSEIRICRAVQVETYDAATQKVSVQPLVQEPEFDESGVRSAVKLPVINGIPVCFPSGGGFRLVYPLIQGDTGILVFSDHSLDVWLSQGGVVDPQVDHKFSLADAIFIPGVHDFAHPLQAVPANTLAIGVDGGVSVFIDNTEIKLGSTTATDFIALGTPLQPFLTAIAAWALTVQSSLNSVGFPIAPLGTAPSVIATKVKGI